MKPLPLFLLAVATLTAPAALRAADFEGQVRMKMSAPRGAGHEIQYRVKPGFVRTELEASGQQTAMIMDLAKKEMLILMPAQKMYMVQSLDSVAAVANDAAGGDEFTFEKTGETAEILGYDCVKYVSKNKELTSDIWVTEELGRFAGLGANANPMPGMGGRQKASPTAAWEKALAGKNFFPLRVISRNAKGEEQFRLETLAVEKGAQPAALFAAPADYQRLDLGNMMKGFGLPGKR